MSDQSQQFPFSDLGDQRSSTDSTLGGGRTSRRRPNTGSSQVEAELAAIFGEDELIRHPPDPFEEKILTGRNSFTDLRDQLAAEDQGESTPPPTTPRPRAATPRPRDPDATPRPRDTTGTTPRPRPATTTPQSRIAELRRNLNEGTRTSSTPGTPSTSSTPAPAEPTSRSRFFHDEPGATPAPAPARTSSSASDAEDRISALRRDLANRRAAAAEAAEDVTRPARTPRPTTQEGVRPRPPREEMARVRPPRVEEPVVVDEFERPRTSRTEEFERPRLPRTEEYERPHPPRTTEDYERPRPPRTTEDYVRSEEAPRPRPTRTPPEPRPRPVPPVIEEDIIEVPPVRERRQRPAPVPEPVEEFQPIEEYPVFEEPVELEHRTRPPKQAPEPEPLGGSSFVTVEPELEPEPVVEKPVPEKRRPKTPPTAPSAAPAPVRKQSVPLTPSSGDVAVLSGVTKTYGRGGQVQALRGVSLAVPQGRMTAIMGRSGAGKSTLLYCMSGLEAPSSGTVTVAGTNLTDMKERQLDKFRRDSVGFVFRSFNLLPALSVADNIRLPLSIKKTSLDQGWYDQIVSTLRLTDLTSKKPTELSPGEQQRVALARALVTKPAIIVADEPTGDLNTEDANDILVVLRDCVAQLGQTVVVATHDAACAAAADQVWVLDDGQVAEQIKSPTLARVIDALRTVSGGFAA